MLGLAPMETNASKEYGYIVKTDGICGGKPCIDGYRIRVQDIVTLHERWGYSPDEILTVSYPQLTLAHVYAALAYYHDHRDQIRKDIEEDQTFVEEFKRQHPSLLLGSKDHLVSRDSIPPG